MVRLLSLSRAAEEPRQLVQLLLSLPLQWGGRSQLHYHFRWFPLTATAGDLCYEEPEELVSFRQSEAQQVFAGETLMGKAGDAFFFCCFFRALRNVEKECKKLLL